VVGADGAHPTFDMQHSRRLLSVNALRAQLVEDTKHNAPRFTS
jgi:hypothetical protein